MSIGVMLRTSAFLSCAICLAVLSTDAWARGSRPMPAPHDAISNNIYTINPQGEEECELTHPLKPSDEIAGRHGRLRSELRQAAALANPFENLKQATLELVQGHRLLALAYADLSVSGRRALESFKQLHEQGRINQDAIVNEVANSDIGQRYSREQLMAAANQMIDRSYKVLHVLHYGNSVQRPSLGYIAVSGEDDQPYRPVNVAGADVPQYDLNVTVQGHLVRTRFIIAQSSDEGHFVPTWHGQRAIPQALRLPSIASDAKILVYVHGMDSRAEEALDIFKALKNISAQTGENWVMISMDMPSSGYADKLDHMQIAPIQEVGQPRSFPPGFNARGRHHVPILDFLENYIVSFVDTLDAQLAIKDKIQAVIGGSLGGNMTFRLGRRHDIPWMKNIVTWSPASIWDGLADGGDIFKQIGVATAWKRAGGEAKNLTETEGHRAEFFRDAFGGRIDIGLLNIVPAQPDQWWRTSWACFSNARAGSEVDREEIYTRNFRLWHWRLGMEQLIFSQQYAPNLDTPRYKQNHVRMLLACGTSDDFNYTNICSATQNTAQDMTTTPGQMLIFKNTGHSIHAERPRLFAREIAKFLK